MELTFKVHKENEVWDVMRDDILIGEIVNEDFAEELFFFNHGYIIKKSDMHKIIKKMDEIDEKEARPTD